MDSLTQAVLGAAVGELMLGKKLGNRALAWGVLFGTLPDLDVLLSPLLDTARKLAVHRGLSHSLLLMIVAAIGLSGPLAKLWKKDKISRSRAGWFVFLAWSTHVLIDCFTVYGTKVFAPFSDYPVGFNNLFIIDFFYTLPLLITVIWLAFLGKKDPRRMKLCVRGLVISSAYVLLSLGAKAWASHGFDADLARRHVTYHRRMEGPTVFNIVLWRSVVDRGDSFLIGYKSILEGASKPVRWVVVPKNKEAFAPVAEMREAKTVDRFSDGWWIARPTAKGVWLADLRFGEIRSWDRQDTVDLRPSFAWQLNVKDDRGDRLQQIQPDGRNIGEAMKRLVYRMIGSEKEWEGSPRLAGNPGILREQLEFVE